MGFPYLLSIPLRKRAGFMRKSEIIFPSDFHGDFASYCGEFNGQLRRFLAIQKWTTQTLY